MKYLLFAILAAGLLSVTTSSAEIIRTVHKDGTISYEQVGKVKGPVVESELIDQIKQENLIKCLQGNNFYCD